MAMRLGTVIRTMGPQSTREIVRECALAAEAAGLDDIWLPDHIAIAPDDSEGSGGRYLDPLATLAYLAAITTRVRLGTGVLVLPYRPALPTAKWVATIQELSAGRVALGVGVGWLASEFNALGVERARRGAITDATLGLLHRCFADDVVEENGQKFLFLPRPARPPIYVGGAPPHAFERALRFGDGWMPMGGDPEKLRGPIAQLRELAEAAGKPAPEVVLLTGFDLREPAKAADQARALADAGVTQLAAGARYQDAAGFRSNVEALAEHVMPAVADL